MQSPGFALAWWQGASNGCGSKLNRRGYAGFGPCFHLQGFHFGTFFVSHSQMALACDAVARPAPRPS